ncbi:MAG: hypothetical protein MdMp014T_0327 [Treponematales bacterium]
METAALRDMEQNGKERGHPVPHLGLRQMSRHLQSLHRANPRRFHLYALWIEANGRRGRAAASRKCGGNGAECGEIGAGIMETIKGIRFSINIYGHRDLPKPRTWEFYIDLNYHSMAKYIEQLGEDTSINRIQRRGWPHETVV